MTYKQINGLLLEEFVSSELESTLQKVSGSSWSESSQQSTGTLGSNDLTETAKHALVVNRGLKLDTCLDAVI